MDEAKIARIYEACFGHSPDGITRCAVGISNYVYIVESAGEKYVIRCSDTPGRTGTRSTG